LVILVLAAISGFVGGLFGSRLRPAGTASELIVRANRFDLVDDRGRVVASWGPGANHGVSIRFVDANGADLASLGIASNGLPLLNFNGHDGRHRFAVTLMSGGEEPYLVFSDPGWEGRILLGNLPGSDTTPEGSQNWGLRFTGPESVSGFARIGMFRNPRTGKTGGELRLHDENGKIWTIPQ
jgi:hypothetical protein